MLGPIPWFDVALSFFLFMLGPIFLPALPFAILSFVGLLLGILVICRVLHIKGGENRSLGGLVICVSVAFIILSLYRLGDALHNKIPRARAAAKRLRVSLRRVRSSIQHLQASVGASSGAVGASSSAPASVDGSSSDQASGSASSAAHLSEGAASSSVPGSLSISNVGAVSPAAASQEELAELATFLLRLENNIEDSRFPSLGLCLYLASFFWSETTLSRLQNITEDGYQLLQQLQQLLQQLQHQDLLRRLPPVLVNDYAHSRGRAEAMAANGAGGGGGSALPEARA
jgi:hypothetical protein